MVELRGMRREIYREPRDERWLESHCPPFQAYEYGKIDSEAGTIRLLRLKPAIYRADILECEMIVCNIANAPEYDALSYCWGPPIFEYSLLCHGRRINIGRSLHRALKCYRQHEDGEKQEYLWVDALCIKQKDTSELNKQLLLMQRI